MAASALSLDSPYSRTAAARVRMVRGFACDVEHGDRVQRVDLPAADGGGATGPHPGQLLRASLGACLAMGYRYWSAHLGIPLEDVTVAVTAEWDVRGQRGENQDVPVGWQRVVFDVLLTSSAEKSVVLGLVDTVHRLSPMLANLATGVERVFRVRVFPSAAPATAE